MKTLSMTLLVALLLVVVSGNSALAAKGSKATQGLTSYGVDLVLPKGWKAKKKGKMRDWNGEVELVLVAKAPNERQHIFVYRKEATPAFDKWLTDDLIPNFMSFRTRNSTYASTGSTTERKLSLGSGQEVSVYDQGFLISIQPEQIPMNGSYVSLTQKDQHFVVVLMSKIGHGINHEKTLKEVVMRGLSLN